jgi:hypothetical protein
MSKNPRHFPESKKTTFDTDYPEILPKTSYERAKNPTK